MSTSIILTNIIQRKKGINFWKCDTSTSIFFYHSKATSIPQITKTTIALSIPKKIIDVEFRSSPS